jgi:hypothetical protein
LLGSLTEFSLRAPVSVLLTSCLPNYRFYLGSDRVHVLLTDPDDPRIPVDRNLYDEASAGGSPWRQGTPLAQWLTDMAESNHGGTWKSISCAPFCTDGTVLQGLAVQYRTMVGNGCFGPIGRRHLLYNLGPC